MLISVRAYAARAFASRLADLRALAPIGARGQVAPSALPRGAPAAPPYPTPPQPRRPAPVQRGGSAECRESFPLIADTTSITDTLGGVSSVFLINLFDATQNLGHVG